MPIIRVSWYIWETPAGSAVKPTRGTSEHLSDPTVLWGNVRWLSSEANARHFWIVGWSRRAII